MCHCNSCPLSLSDMSEGNMKLRSSLKRPNANESKSMEKEIIPVNKVRFADTKEISFVVPRSEMSTEEANDIWYTYEDYNYFKMDCYVITSSYRQAEVNKFLIKAYRTASMGNVDSSLSNFLK